METKESDIISVVESFRDSWLQAQPTSTIELLS